MHMRTYGKRFLIGWIISSLGMFGLSYVFHGIILNDYQLIQYDLWIYLTAASIAYLFIGFLVSRAFLIEYFEKFSKHPLVRGPLIGFACGMLVYIVSTTINIGFNKGLDLKYLVLDITWQGIEQAIGGVLIGLVYMFVFEPLPYMPHEEE